MTLQRKLITSKNSIIDIVSDDLQTQQHFYNPANYADVVLDQFNQDRFYDDYFKDKDNLTVLDLGGNIGLFSLFAQDRCKAIYTFEPTPTHYHILKELTKNYPNIHPVQLAVHNQDSKIDFYVMLDNSTMNSTYNTSGIKIEVEGKKLSSIIKSLNLDHVDFVKCDIEGSEMVALTDETVAEVANIVDHWYIEVHATGQSRPMSFLENVEFNCKHIEDIFTRCGYTVKRLRFDAMHAFKQE